MRNIVRQSARLALLVPLAVAPIAGCATTEPTVTTTSSTTVNRTVLYPGGRYQLYGDGMGTPYHWVWIPTGGNIVNSPPPLPAIPANTVVTTPVPAGSGQYQLYGNGSTVPFYWVWVPAGATPPPPPLPPRM
jgi:hypothetical protein